MSAKFQLAEINIGRLKAPIDDPLIRDFADNLDRINALAEASPGFVWRLTGEGNNATDLAIDDDPLLIPNLSVWTDIAALGAFVYRSGHVELMRRRHDWFEARQDSMALWWVPDGHRPTLAEALERLAQLATRGPGPEAFTFRTPFPAPTGQADAPVPDECA